MSTYRAVVFDLWGTLVDELTCPEANRLIYRQKTDETADLLGLDRDEFAEAWAEGAGERLVDVFSTEGALLHICGRAGSRAGPRAASGPPWMYGSSTCAAPCRPGPGQSRRSRR